MQAVILAAGEGKRVRPLTHGRPKALIPVVNRPVLGHVIDAVITAGIRDIIVVVGYRKEQVMRYLNSLDLPVQVVVQDRQLGTGHALSCAEHLLADRFLVLPGDNTIDAGSVSQLLTGDHAILVKEHNNPSNFGVVLARDGYLTQIIEKPEAAPSFTVSTGIFSLDRTVFPHMDDPDLTSAIASMVRSGTRFRVVPATDWQDAIYPWDINTLNGRLLPSVKRELAGRVSRETAIRGAVRCGEGTTIEPFTTITGPVIIGKDTVIGPHTCILPGTSIGSGVTIGPFSVIGNAVIMDRVTIGASSHISDAVIGEGCGIGDHTAVVSGNSPLRFGGGVVTARFGAVLGDDVTTGPFTILEQCVVGNGVSIAGGSRVRLDSALRDRSMVM